MSVNVNMLVFQSKCICLAVFVAIRYISVAFFPDWIFGLKVWQIHFRLEILCTKCHRLVSNFVTLFSQLLQLPEQAVLKIPPLPPLKDEETFAVRMSTQLHSICLLDGCSLHNSCSLYYVHSYCSSLLLWIRCGELVLSWSSSSREREVVVQCSVKIWNLSYGRCRGNLTCQEPQYLGLFFIILHHKYLVELQSDSMVFYICPKFLQQD